MLRMCGLELKEILEIIGVVSDGKFVPDHPNRRAQQIVRELVSQEYPPLSSADSETIENMASMLNQIKKEGKGKSKPEGQRWREGSPISPKASSILGITPGFDTRLLPYKNESDSSAPGSRYGSSSSAGSSPSDTSQALEPYNNSPTQPGAMIPNQILPSRHSILRGLLKGHGRSSACISEIVSLLSGFTMSTSGRTKSKKSTGSDMSMNEDGEYPLADFDTFQTLQDRRMEQANATVLGACCSVRSGCLHRQLAQAVSASGQASGRSFQVTDTSEINWRDPFGNNFLFFASRIGAPADILISIVEDTKNIDAVNDDGQNFMFVLDPSGFTKNAGTSYKFLMLLNTLEQRGFDFEHFDYDGRSFLSVLVTRPTFKMEWLTQLYAQKKWKARLGTLARHRDASGLFLIDYLNQHPEAHTLDKKVISHLLKDFDLSNFKVGQTRTLKSDFEMPGGQSPLHQMCSRTNLMDVKGNLSAGSFFFCFAGMWANHYDVHGDTPLFAYLRVHGKGPSPELFAIKDMIKRGGSDVNQRNREGGTVLHFAAKHSLLTALDFFISCGANINHRDYRGFSALDHAVGAYNRSRMKSEKAELMAKSLKCIRMLLDHGAHAAYLPDAKGKRVRTKKGNQIVIPDTDVWNEAVMADESSRMSVCMSFAEGGPGF